MKTLLKKLAAVLIILVLIYILFRTSVLLGFATIIAGVCYLVIKCRIQLMSFAGTAYYSRGNTKKSFEWFKRAYYSKAATAKVKILYAYLLLRSGDTEQADKILAPLVDSRLTEDEMMHAKSNYSLVLWKKDFLMKLSHCLPRLLKNIRLLLSMEVSDTC